MEIAKRKRRVIRAQATRIINEADDILAKQRAPDTVAKQLSDVNAAIEPHILEEDADAEFEQAMEYDDKIASCLGSMKSFGKRLIDLQPVTSARNVRELRRLYDDLQVHMRGLKALGVGEDSYNTMLYPMLLRALPQEIVLNYHRSQAEAQPDLCTSSTDGSSSAGSATEHHTALTTLLRYLRRELESQERALEHRPDNSVGKPEFYYDREKVKTQRSNCRPSSAAALHGSAADVACEICASTDHESKDCNSNLDLAEKKAILSAKGICFRCTKKAYSQRVQSEDCMQDVQPSTCHIHVQSGLRERPKGEGHRNPTERTSELVCFGS
ncbi:hypothetical protein HPB50_023836 [Hyalomma asiaticum]|uniref:Uncharacterized protein n=1 Tax=Hyalomma asiaticum TaxID=266040 RepID=A0ACB7S4Y8_HYAAI|nr:hypothetical protein HPB50_023836 [Hyalomma asiaticum]